MMSRLELFPPQEPLWGLTESWEELEVYRAPSEITAAGFPKSSVSAFACWDVPEDVLQWRHDHRDGQVRGTLPVKFLARHFPGSPAVERPLWSSVLLRDPEFALLHVPLTSRPYAFYTGCIGVDVMSRYSRMLMLTGPGVYRSEGCRPSSAQ